MKYAYGGEEQEGTATDISEGGLGLRGKTYAPGTVISAYFEGPEPTGAGMKIESRVCHTRPDAMGVQFLSIGEAERLRILEIIYLGIALRRR